MTCIVTCITHEICICDLKVLGILVGLLMCVLSYLFSCSIFCNVFSNRVGNEYLTKMFCQSYIFQINLLYYTWYSPIFINSGDSPMLNNITKLLKSKSMATKNPRWQPPCQCTWSCDWNHIGAICQSSILQSWLKWLFLNMAEKVSLPASVVGLYMPVVVKKWAAGDDLDIHFRHWIKLFSDMIRYLSTWKMDKCIWHTFHMVHQKRLLISVEFSGFFFPC